ncbi:PREDICTED: ankyrin-1-like [Erythranthe guttata]|uniref:ankyrin-1-like n=1 Tax=Erythranthe guttata TaxID=4155 RepID=UPI00064DD1CE|nr:PREDICTED: ankyrin-1-like [Erythranthe guttata]|eukprot:XP_012835989.1 PREDICTED: ankyrin-1-like [Erythranthe guttata]
MYTPDEDDILIQKAAASGDLELLQELEVKLGGNELEEHCDTPLILALQKRRFITSKYLINRGADITIADRKGKTSLHYAAEQDNKELMQMLLSKGADIESNSVNGTPLQCAAASGNVESVRLLLGHGANPNLVSSISPSPLVSAIISQSYECFELLLKAGADPNIISSGLRPLTCAIPIGEAGFLKSLLAAGANPNLVTSVSFLFFFSDNDNNSLKPIEQAISVGNLDFARILFPLTERIPSYPDWSIHGIVNYFHTVEANMKRELRKNAYFRFVDQEGKNAVKIKDYATAVKWFSEVI